MDFCVIIQNIRRRPPLKIDLSLLEALGTEYGSTSVSIDRFFLSYNSVLTLAYRAFSRTLLDVKAHIELALGDALKAENPGSKWPKTTLACLIDDRPLTEPQVMTLRLLCTQFAERLHSLPESEKRVVIDELKLVVIGNRTHEKRQHTFPIRLCGRQAMDDCPPQQHVDFVAAIMAEFDEPRHAEYYPRLAPEGRTLDDYYRKDHVETTLVADVTLPPKARRIVDDLRDEISHRLPGLYGWFDPARWHLTVRTLTPR